MWRRRQSSWRHQIWRRKWRRLMKRRQRQNSARRKRQRNIKRMWRKYRQWQNRRRINGIAASKAARQRLSANPAKMQKAVASSGEKASASMKAQLIVAAAKMAAWRRRKAGIGVAKRKAGAYRLKYRDGIESMHLSKKAYGEMARKLAA